MSKVVLVTGGSRGIGRSIVKEYAKNGYDVVINYVNSDSIAFDLCNSLEEEYGVNALSIKCDVSDEDEVKLMIEEIVDKFGKIDVVVNNAGIAIDSVISDKTKESFRKVLDVNLIGTFLVCKYASLYMDEGAIVNVSSTNGIDSFYPFSMDYDASKAGVNNLTKNLAVEFAPRIRVNAVAPGWVNTDMNKLLDDEFLDEENSKICLGRFAEPSEIARVVYFLSSDDASYINGEIIKVDGGRK
jgi:3-oxoacyl-[acyl-carrier protein] reductase